MAFTEVSWSNGDYVTETKMDQMVASDVHVREESNYVPVLTASITELSEAGGAGPAAVVAIDGTTIASFSGTPDAVDADNSISGYSTGLHTITVAITPAYGSHDGLRRFKFYKTPDMNYLTVWYSAYQEVVGADPVFTVFDITVIGHRETKSWTT